MKEKVAALGENADEALKPFCKLEARKLEQRLLAFEPRLQRSAVNTTRCREDGRRKEREEIATLEKRTKSAIKHHQRDKSLSNEDLFKAMGAKDETLSESAFIKFFSTCQKQAPEGDDATDSVPTPDELSRLFSHLDEEEEGFLVKDKIFRLIRVYMKVVKDSVVTSTLSIKESTSIRRLELGEVVEVLEGPMKEPVADVMRVRAKVMKDAVEGWITVTGNKDTVFLEEGGTVFKVVKETIMTDSFQLDGGNSTKTTRRLKDTTRKLKEGELVEVIEWQRKEEKSQLMRMRCRARNDGAVGWATTVGNQGIVFLSVV